MPHGGRTLTLLAVAVGLSLAADRPASGQEPVWQSDRIDRLRERIESLRTERGIPSAQVALIRADSVVVLIFGRSDLATGEPVTEATMFRAGSVSKSVAGVAMMMLVERGLVGLDDRLRDLAPELDIRNPWSADRPVRLAHLLEAGAGFVGFHPDDYEAPPNPLEIPLERVVRDWGRLDVQWRPGSYTSYHDRGPTLTAYLVEKLTGRSYRDFVREEIFGPLGMDRSGYFRTGTVARSLAEPPAVRDSSATAYAHYRLWPSGSLNTSARDFSRFVRMLLDRGTFRGRHLLRPESVARIETPTTTLAARKAGAELGHGINSFTMSYRDVVYHGHPGNTDNYTAAYGYRPESGTGFVFMSTVSADGRWMLWQAVNEILAFLTPDAGRPPAREMSSEERAAVTGCFERLNPWVLGRPLDEVRVREEGGSLTMVHGESGRVEVLKGGPRPMSFRVAGWREERDELTGVVLVHDEGGRLVLQMLSYPFEAYGKLPCR